MGAGAHAVVFSSLASAMVGCAWSGRTVRGQADRGTAAGVR
ncbi:putative lipoprotein [Nocardiopsis alba ATCC BAA-2165]|uniref:Putative lipoprotein n=1 Tax=Nocardiopsis alba (strain ATCC BAA-2165 / BE74) TaxID=1205910 RepID=J7L0A0_NOCAA|nr:putative lipoprotein [Nocardiopsis alba ATCC BAA-2165]